MEEASANAKPRNLLATPQTVDLAVLNDREYPALLSNNLSLPDRCGNGVDAALQQSFVEQRRCGVLGVFDQQLAVADRQLVDEAVAVALLDCRIHDDRARHAVRR